VSYGMWISASGAMAQLARQDVASNNLANASTTGFKADFLAIRARDAARQEDNLPWMDSNAMLERLGAGVMPEPNQIRLDEGPITETGDSLDVAVRGDGFLRVRSRDGEGFAFTRDGRLTVSPDGALARATDGRPVLDAGGREITLDRTLPVVIDASGGISQGGAEVARLSFVGVEDGSMLHKAGANDLTLKRGVSERDALRPAGGQIVQGAIEGSAVNLFGALMSATGAARAAQGALRMVGTFDEINGLAVTRLGRVS